MEEVERRFLLDCQQRQLSAPLPAGMYAGGQYFDEPQRRQRGLHGTAAALLVMGASAQRGDDGAREVARGLVAYLNERDAVEMHLAANINRSRNGIDRTRTFDEEGYWSDKLRHDRVNTSKQSELLYSLSFVQTGTADTNALHNESYAGLMAGRSPDGLGWGLVLDAGQDSDRVATAYVVRALHAHGHDVRQEGAWLREGLTANVAAGAPARGELEADCLILRVLVEAKLIEPGDARRVFDRLWKHLESRLGELAAQKVPFDDQPKNHFLLVHWQLHLLGLAADLRPFRRFLSRASQSNLWLHIEAVDKGESLAPVHDVDGASTRHYAYYYQLLRSIVSDRSSPAWLDTPVGVAIDVVTATLKWIRRFAWAVLAILMVALVVRILVSALRDGFTLSELAPEMLGAGLLGVLSYLARQGRPK